MAGWEDFAGLNRGYVLELYDKYRQDPSSVDPETRAIFDAWTPTAEPASPVAAEGMPLHKVVGAVNLVLLVSVLALVAAMISNASSRDWIMTSILMALAAGLSVAMIYNGATRRFDVHPKKGAEETHLLFSKWNSFSRISVVGDLDEPEIRIIIDSDAATDVTKGAGAIRTLPGRPARLAAFGYHLKRAPNVLIIGSGGGKDVIAARAFGANYVSNILRQQQAPRRPQPPLRLRDPRLNELATDPLSLLAYDAFILESGKESEHSARETGSTEPVDDEPPTGDDDL